MDRKEAYADNDNKYYLWAYIIDIEIKNNCYYGRSFSLHECSIYSLSRCLSMPCNNSK